MSKKEARFEGTNWDEPEVRVIRHGVRHSSLERKVVTKGVKKIECTRALNDAIRLLRMGYEVRLANAKGEAIRLYPCLMKDLKTMFVGAMTMGEFRSMLSDKKARLVNRGEEVDGESLAEEQKKRYEEAQSVRITPDTMVTCPKCGTQFRVGKKLA